MNETDYLKQNWLKLIILAPLAFLIVDILLMYMGISGLLAAISVMILTSNMLTSKILFDMWAQQIEFYTLFAKFSRALAEYFSSKKRGRSNAKKK